MIFPFISVPEEVLNGVPIDNTLPLYREVAWNFDEDIPVVENGDFKIIEGNEAIKVWIYKALKTPRYQFQIYSWDYGSEVMELIGKAYSNELTKSESKRYIQEALLINPYITNVEVVDTSFKDDLLTAKVKITTVYGEVTINV